MAELELEGLHPDGEHLVLIGPDGHRYRLVIDDALRAAVRRDRARMEQIRSSDNLRPREIQSRIRAGEDVEEVALESGLPVEYIRRYEGPVVAERTWVAEQARLLPVGREADAPALGDLVVDRLAARGVAPDDLSWTATRRAGEPWELVLTFRAGDRERVAHWTVDLQTRSLHARDDEGRWLSEVELGAPSARRHLSTVRARALAMESDDPPEAGPDEPPPAPAGEEDRTADLLEELRASRGVRREAPSADVDEDAWGEPPPAHPPASAPQERPDASVLPLRAASTDAAAETAAPATDAPRKPKSRQRRQSIPTWDEIVFGAKPE